MGLLEQTQQPQQPQGSPEQQPGMQERLRNVQKMAMAGLKILYDEKMHQKFLPLLKGGDPVESAAEVAHRLMLLVMMAAKMEMDPKNVIPAGTLLIGDVLDFIQQARGITHTEEDVDRALELFVRKMMETVQ